MKPQDEKQIQQTFDSFCKKVLKNTARELYRRQKKEDRQEIPFSQLSERELSALSVVDLYGTTETVFDVLGSDVVVFDDDIASALKKLPEQKRAIVLLAYFVGMTDLAIATRLDLLRRTVTNRRASSLRELKRLWRKMDMSETNCAREPLKLDIILAAINGEEDAMRAVLNYYKGYIYALATKRLYDEDGRQYLFVDDEMRHELELRMLTKMASFKPAVA